MRFLYKNGNYNVLLNTNNGTKLRILLDDSSNFIAKRPESIDMTITYKCSVGCKYCYLNCNQNGKHANLKEYETLLKTIPPYTELAINGNDLYMPDFEWFLQLMKQKHVLVNITVNINYLNEQIIDYIKELQLNNFIYGIGISLPHNFDKDKLILIKDINNVVLHVINGIFTLDDFESAANILNKKILILGYKLKGRAKLSKKIITNQKELQNNITNIFNKFDYVIFDNLALEQLKIKEKVNEQDWNSHFMGEEGSATFFIDLVKGTFAKSSTEKDDYPIYNKNINDMFWICQNN